MQPPVPLFVLCGKFLYCHCLLWLSRQKPQNAPQNQQIHNNTIRPSITICPWARYGQSSVDTHGFDTLERERRQWSILSGRRILTVSPESAFLLFFSYLLLGLRIQNRQVFSSIAPWRNDDWNNNKKRAHSYRLQRTLNRWCDREADH